MAKTTQKGRLMEIFTPLGTDYLLIRKLDVTEGLSQLFTMDVEVLFEESKVRMKTNVVAPESILGKPITIALNQNLDANESRFFCGIVNRISQGARSEQYSIYNLTVVPHVWLLTQKTQSRIYPDTSVPDILKDVLNGFDVKWNLGGTYHPRTYCVQYRETDWDFACRLMEEEGIFYYFVHEDGTDKLLLGDDPGHHYPCPNKSEFAYYVEGTDSDPEDNPIVSWFTDHQLQTGKVTLWDYHFQLRPQTLSLEQPGAFPAGDSVKLESYDFPGGYAKKYDGVDKMGGSDDSNLNNVFDDRARTAKARIQALDSTFAISHGSSRCSPFTAGYKFTLSKHPNKERNGNYVLTSVRHSVNQSPEYFSEQEIDNPYDNLFECIPHGSGAPPFKPLLRTPRPIVYGTQTATVVGPSGEEIFTDKYGRVKVQFNWDRASQFDPSSSAWVRVAQGWAGNKWGIMFIPRVGMEVVVHFLEGDPDQPIITGCVYNVNSMPPYGLPDEKTKSTIKSNTSKGGGGFNEFRFEDKAGSEQIFIHGEKDQDILIKNDNKQKIGNDQHLTVISNQKEKIGGDKHLHVVGDHKEKIDGSMSLQVGSNLQEKTGQKYAMDSGTEIHLKAGMKVVIEGGVQVTMKVGGNFVDINPSGVTISGTLVLINSGGAAGSGSGSSPDAPEDPTAPSDSEAGQAMAQPQKPTPPDKYSPEAEAMAGAADKGTPYVGSGMSGTSDSERSASGGGSGDAGGSSGGGSGSGSGGAGGGGISSGGGGAGGGSSDSGSGGGDKSSGYIDPPDSSSGGGGGGSDKGGDSSDSGSGGGDKSMGYVDPPEGI